MYILFYVIFLLWLWLTSWFNWLVISSLFSIAGQMWFYSVQQLSWQHALFQSQAWHASRVPRSIRPSPVYAYRRAPVWIEYVYNRSTKYVDHLCPSPSDVIVSSTDLTIKISPGWTRRRTVAEIGGVCQVVNSRPATRDVWARVYKYVAETDQRQIWHGASDWNQTTRSASQRSKPEQPAARTDDHPWDTLRHRRTDRRQSPNNRRRPHTTTWPHRPPRITAIKLPNYVSTTTHDLLPTRH